jgi:hypothetical protein
MPPAATARWSPVAAVRRSIMFLASRTSRGLRRLTCAAAFALVVVPSFAQRPTVEFKIKDRKISLEYGAVPLGRHSLDELKVGSTWRMGSNSASSLETDLPILAEERVLAPGAYRANIARTGDAEGDFNIDGAGAATGNGGAVGFPGKFTKASQPAKKLTITIPSNGKDQPGVKLAKFVVDFGLDRLESPVTVVGAKSSKTGGWAVDVFTYPRDILEKRMAADQATPIASIRRQDPNDAKKNLAYNLVVGKDKARLIPWMEMPKGENGFATPEPPDAEKIKDGKIEAAPSQKSTETLDVVKVELKKGEGFVFNLNVGEQALTIVAPDPLAKK